MSIVTAVSVTVSVVLFDARDAGVNARGNRSRNDIFVKVKSALVMYTSISMPN